jgi:multidrug resistance efflux pump
VSDPSANHDAPEAPADLRAPGRPLSLSDRVRSLRLPQRAAAPPPRRAWLPWLLCAALGGCTLYLLLNQRGAGAGKTDDGQAPAEAAKTPAKGESPAGEVLLETKGYIMPTHPYKVGPNQVGSKIKKLHERFLEGQWISKDTVLAELDDTQYRKKYEQAQGDYEAAKHEVDATVERFKVAQANRPEEVRQAKAELEEAEAVCKKLEQDLKRTDNLKTTRAYFPQDYDNTMFAARAQQRRVRMLTEKYKLIRETRLEVRREAEANLAKARANLARAESAREEAKWLLDNCVIRAPIDGTILKKYVELEDPLDARAFNLAAILCDMADLRDLEVELSVQEREIARIEEGQDCLVRPETYTDKTFKGIVSRKMPNADRSKGAIPVRVKVLDIPDNNRDQYLVPDGGAIVTFLGTPRDRRRENLKRLRGPAAAPPAPAGQKKSIK